MVLLLPDRPAASRPRPEERLNRRGSLQPGDPGRPPRSMVIALVLACLTFMAVDRLGASSPLDPVRRVLGEATGPAQAGAAAVVDPFLSVPRWLHRQGTLTARVAELEAERAELESQLRAAPYDRNQLAEYRGLTATAGQLGAALVPARVIGFGPAQSFDRTVTIDAGTDAGLTTDLTVVNADGLVGRVIRTTTSTATVLLTADADSTVGGRIAESMELGMVRGGGDLGDSGTLALDLVDQQFTPHRGDSVVTFGSEGGAPYVAGVPIGEVRSVREDVRDSTHRAVIEPFVDFSALDVVGVVVPSGSESDRGVIEADGSMR